MGSHWALAAIDVVGEADGGHAARRLRPHGATTLGAEQRGHPTADVGPFGSRPPLRGRLILQSTNFGRSKPVSEVGDAGAG